MLKVFLLGMVAGMLLAALCSWIGGALGRLAWHLFH